jgi:Trk K+ transport system NAD-binding subunit
LNDMPSVTPGFELTPQQPADRPGEILLVGADALGIDVCRRLLAAGKSVAVIWQPGAHNIDEVEMLGVQPVLDDARRGPVLSRAGVRVASTLVAVTQDDQFNLRVTLVARDLNPHIRVVLRQFNRRLGQKISRQLANSEAVSPETHAAATFAASCLNSSVYRALEFPRYSEDLVAFCQGSAADFGVTGLTVAEIRRRRGWQVLAIDSERFCPDAQAVEENVHLTLASRVESAPSAPHVRSSSASHGEPDVSIVTEHQRAGLVNQLRRLRLDPIFVSLVAALLILVAGATAFFHFALGLNGIESFYHVINTVTTTGADALSPLPDSARAVEIVLMVGSIAIVGVLLAYVTAAITRRSLDLAQGRHRYLGSGHVVVCGFGNVGSRVAQYLQHQGRRVVVIDREPDSALATEVRARGAHIMTADATSESSLELAGVSRASALLALTDSDSANLEIALTAAAFSPGLPIVTRISEASMAHAVERHFGIQASYSAAELAAPLVAGLALEHGSRGSVEIAGETFALAQKQRSTYEAEPGELVLADDADFVLVIRTGSAAR